jgi:hypothetical protein
VYSFLQHVTHEQTQVFFVDLLFVLLNGVYLGIIFNLGTACILLALSSSIFKNDNSSSFYYYIMEGNVCVCAKFVMIRWLCTQLGLLGGY